MNRVQAIAKKKSSTNVMFCGFQKEFQKLPRTDVVIATSHDTIKQ